MIKYYRAMTWLQVILQASIPLLTTVTPVAKASLHIEEELAMRKKVYTLAQGENVSTVAAAHVASVAHQSPYIRAQ